MLGTHTHTHTHTHTRHSADGDGDGDEDAEDEDDDARVKNYALSDLEIRELDEMTRRITQILNDYNRWRVANQSRHNSRPATPMDSPVFPMSRLPSFGGHPGGSRSGYSTPSGHNFGGASFISRPGTPSGLSRRWG